jgi:hypothetical protein
LTADDAAARFTKIFDALLDADDGLLERERFD